MNMMVVPVALMAVRSVEKCLLPVNRYLATVFRLWLEITR